MHRGVLLAVALGLALGSTTARALTVDEVVGLLGAGVGESVIRDQMEAEQAHLDLTARDILALKQAGASDELIRALIRSGTGRNRQDVTGSRGEPGMDDAYASPGVRVRVYYDPFGYHWFASPWAYAYYDPFPWSDCGFYYAGWWDCRWWRWGSWCVDARARYCGGGHARWHRDRPRVDGGRTGWACGDRDGTIAPSRGRRAGERSITRTPPSRPPRDERPGLRGPGRTDRGGRSAIRAPAPSAPPPRARSADRSGWRR